MLCRTLNFYSHASNSLSASDLSEFAVTDLKADGNSHTFNFDPYKVIIFSPYSNYKETPLGEKLATWVEAGGRLLMYPVANCSSYLTLKGRMTKNIPLSRGQFSSITRTITTIHDTPFRDAFMGYQNQSFKAYWSQNAKMVREDENCFRVAETSNGYVLAAATKVGEGWVFQVNIGLSSGADQQMGKNILLQAVRFLTRFEIEPPIETPSLLFSEEPEVAVIQFGDDKIYTMADARIIVTCGETIKNIYEGDPTAEVYRIKLPSTKNLELFAQYFKTGKIHPSDIDPRTFVSLLQSADYLQSDYLLNMAKIFFSNVSNARQVSLMDEDFNSHNVPLQTLQLLIPGIDALILSPSWPTSPWKDIFANYLRNAMMKNKKASS